MYLGGDLNQGPILCSQSSTSAIHHPAPSVSGNIFKYQTRIVTGDINSYFLMYEFISGGAGDMNSYF